MLMMTCVSAYASVAIGDPIEVGAATSVLQPRKSYGQTHHLLLSSFKSEGGHAEPAAGVMGLLRLAAQVGCITMMMRSTMVPEHAEKVFLKYWGPRTSLKPSCWRRLYFVRCCTPQAALSAAQTLLRGPLRLRQLQCGNYFARLLCISAGHSRSSCSHPAPEDAQPLPALGTARTQWQHRPVHAGPSYGHTLVQPHPAGQPGGRCQLFCVHGHQRTRRNCRTADKRRG
jgi:hypothetical protein